MCGLSRQMVSHGSGLSRQVALYCVLSHCLEPIGSVYPAFSYMERVLIKQIISVNMSSEKKNLKSDQDVIHNI